MCFLVYSSIVFSDFLHVFSVTESLKKAREYRQQCVYFVRRYLADSVYTTSISTLSKTDGSGGGGVCMVSHDCEISEVSVDLVWNFPRQNFFIVTFYLKPGFAFPVVKYFIDS